MSTPELDDPALRRELGRLAPAVDEAEGLAAVRSRTATARRRRIATRVGIACAAVAVVTAGTRLVVVDGAGDEPLSVGAGRGDSTSVPPGARPERGAAPGAGAGTPATVDVGVEPSVAGPLRVAVSATAPAPNAWLAHHLTLVNESHEEVRVDLRPEATVVESDGPVLLAGDDLCGYAVGDDGTAVPACRLPAAPTVVLAPGEAHDLKITLWRDLPGFGDLVPGRYTVERSFEVTSPPSGAPITAIVTITYDVGG